MGPPVLLADGFAAIEVDGRRLAAVGMVLIGVVTLSAVRSVWWAIVPMLSGWVIWLATEDVLAPDLGIQLALSGGPLVAQIIVLTMPAASHLAIHFRDDRRREADAATGGPADARGRRRADHLDGDHRRHRLRGTHHQRCDADPAVRGDPRHLHSVCGDPRDADLADRHAAAFPPGDSRFARARHSRVSAAMNRLTYLGLITIPARSWLPWPRWSFPSRWAWSTSTYETNYINLFHPQTRVVKDYKRSSHKLGGSAWSRSWCRLASRSRPGRWVELGDVGDRQIATIPVPDPRAISQVLSLATVLDPDGRIAALPEPRKHAS